MRTMKLEIDGEMKDVLVFESMWEYIQHYDSDITHYRYTGQYTQERIIRSFKPIDDVTFSTHSSDMVEIEGEYFQRVWWGESETCVVPEADLMAQFWTVYEWGGAEYECTGAIYQAEEDAREEVA